MEKLIGRTALVTGSTDGVGRLVARKLGQAGARVLVHGRNAKRGARVVADIKASGGTADFLAAARELGSGALPVIPVRLQSRWKMHANVADLTITASDHERPIHRQPGRAQYRPA